MILYNIFHTLPKVLNPFIDLRYRRCLPRSHGPVAAATGCPYAGPCVLTERYSGPLGTTYVLYVFRMYWRILKLALME